VIYGTTEYGGYNCPHSSNQGCGTAFELSPPSTKGGAWVEKVIHRFNPSDSYEAWPMAGLIMDRNGRLFGTTQEDTVFRLAPSSNSPGSWIETILYSFKGKGASYALDAPLIFDSTGNLYSIAYAGSGGSVDGNVFRLRPPTGNGNSWTIDVLYSFAGSPDGAWPAAGLIFDKHGSLYSTTQEGGSGQACQGGCGTVFEFDSTGTEQLLYSFLGFSGSNSDGWFPESSLVEDSKGNLYTTETYRGQRVQKFNYKGIAAVTAPNEGAPWPSGRK